MNSIKLALLAVSIWPGLAFSEYTGPGYGLSTGNQRGVQIGDFNLFTPGKVSWGLKRYGGAYMDLFVGNGVGLNVMGHPGFLLLDNGTIFFGAEPGAGALRLNTSAATQTFYEWTPMLSTGVMVMTGPVKLITALRGGVGFGTINSNGVLPTSNSAGGYAIYLDVAGLQAGYTQTHIGQSQIRSVDLYKNDKIGIRYEMVDGKQQETNVMGLLRFKLQ